MRPTNNELAKRALSLEIQADLAEPIRGGGRRIVVLGYTTLADGNRAQVARQEFPDENTAKELESTVKPKAELESELKNAKLSSDQIELLRDQG